MDSQKVYKKAPKKAVKTIKQMLENNIANLIPADVYYVAKIMHSSIKNLLKHTNTSINGSSLALNETLPTAAPPPNEAAFKNLTEATLDIVRIYNYLMEMNENVLRSSTVLNSTNILLDSFESLMDSISLYTNFEENATDFTELAVNMSAATNSSSSNAAKSAAILEETDKTVTSVSYNDVGVTVKSASNFLIFIINPLIAKVSGVALYRLPDDIEQTDNYDYYYEDFGLQGAFEHEFYKFLLSNESVDDLLNDPQLQMATFVPNTLLDRLDEISLYNNQSLENRPEPRIVIKFYSNDKLFQEKNISKTEVYGKVVSISIPGHDKELPEMLPLIFRSKAEQSANNDSSTQRCSYWNYETWANDGLTFMARSEVDENLILCACTHLTPFAYLIGANYNFSVDSDIEVVVKGVHEEALDIITLLGCSLSLFGIIGIFITACTFQSWRKKASSRVLLQLSAAIALQMILFCFVNTEEISHHLIANQIYSSCIIIGASLHYSVLVQFCWMIIIAYLQFKRYVQVFGNTRPKRFFIKSTLIGWGIPLLLVLLVLLIDKQSYISHEESINTSYICYPSGNSLYFGIIMPVTIAVIINLIIFILVIYNILRGPDGSIRHTQKKLALSQVRLSILLFFLLGFTWIFGLLATTRAGLVFSYLFCLTATLQGFVIFIYFIVLDPITRRMWGGYFRRLFNIKEAQEQSGTSVKESTQTF